MASIETNMAFVKELLSSKKITDDQSKEILDLLAKEFSALIQVQSNEQENKTQAIRLTLNKGKTNQYERVLSVGILR